MRSDGFAGRGQPGYLRRLARSQQVGRRLRATLWLVAGSAALYALLLGDGGLLRIHRLHREIDRLQSDLQWLRGEQARLREDLEALAEPGGEMLERVAREHYGLRRPGERVLHVLGSEDATLTPDAPALTPPDLDRMSRRN